MSLSAPHNLITHLYPLGASLKREGTGVFGLGISENPSPTGLRPLKTLPKTPKKPPVQFAQTAKTPHPTKIWEVS